MKRKNLLAMMLASTVLFAGMIPTNVLALETEIDGENSLLEEEAEEISEVETSYDYGVESIDDSTSGSETESNSEISNEAEETTEVEEVFEAEEDDTLSEGDSLSSENATGEESSAESDAENLTDASTENSSPIDSESIEKKDGIIETEQNSESGSIEDNADTTIGGTYVSEDKDGIIEEVLESDEAIESEEADSLDASSNYGYLVNMPNGVYNISTADASFMALDVYNGRKTNGTNVSIWDKHNGKNQQFRVTKLSNGFYKIISVDSGKSLDFYGGVARNGSNLQIWDYHGGSNQLWKFYDAGDGHVFIRSKLGLVIDNADGTVIEGNNVLGWSINAGSNQKWDLIPCSDYKKASINFDSTVKRTRYYYVGLKNPKKVRIRSLGGFHTNPLTDRISTNRGPKIKIDIYRIDTGKKIKSATLNPSGRTDVYTYTLPKNYSVRLQMTPDNTANFTRLEGCYFVEELY